jgi:hypothetical protein
MKIYIAGPITGIFDYKKKFKDVERRISSKGHIILNPSFLPDGLKDYMSICKAMIDQADAVYFMRGWENSMGSKEEFAYARSKGMKIITERETESYEGCGRDNII